MARKYECLDADESVYLNRQLEHVKAKVYETRYPEFQARELIPTSFDVDPGAETIGYDVWDVVGMAKIISNYATDIPRVDIAAKRYNATVRSMADAYGYSIQDIRAARLARVDLTTKKAAAAKRAMRAKEDDVAFNGDAAYNVVGLLNHANVTDVAIPNGVSTTATWATKTAAEIIADMNLVTNTIGTLTNGVEIPDTMLLPPTQRSLIATMQMPNLNTTVLKFFLENNEYIKEIRSVAKLKGAGAGGTDAMIVYRRSPEVLTLEIPQDFEQFPAQERGLEFIVNCHQRIGGVLISLPLAIAKADGI